MTKIDIFIANPECVLKGDYLIGLKSCGDDMHDYYVERGYPLIKTIEVDFGPLTEDLTKQAVKDIEREETRIRAESQAEITDLERRKAELLSIPFIPEAS